MKIYAYVAIIAMFGAGIWYVIHLAADNERLAQNNASLKESNAAYDNAIAELEADKAAKDKAILERTKKILALNEQILKAKDEIRNITTDLVTEKERECLRSDVPVAVIDFMFNRGPSDPETGDSEDMPGDSAIQRD